MYKDYIILSKSWIRIADKSRWWGYRDGTEAQAQWLESHGYETDRMRAASSFNSME
jgi:hypothetical protein